jgi:diguanylate cyclase (GGDEF)-like protein
VIRGVSGASRATTTKLIGTDVALGGDEKALAWLASPEPRLLRSDTQSAIVRTVLSTLGIDALLLVPIRRRGKLLGASGAGFVGAAPDPAELVNRSLAVADHAAIALDNANLLARVTHQALHDDLTGVASRLHFEEETERSLARAVRDRTDVSLAFLDLDCFKDVNDEHGHTTGDRVLREVARRLRVEVRTGDSVGRLGGDEFAVMLWGAGPEEAIAVAERIRRAIEEPIFAHPTVRVSASIGVATAIAGDGSYSELLRRSDTAMYRAKRAGRNACVAIGT